MGFFCSHSVLLKQSCWLNYTRSVGELNVTLFDELAGVNTLLQRENYFTSLSTNKKSNSDKFSQLESASPLSPHTRL